MASLPVLLYDGRCGFCRMWLEYLQALEDGKCVLTGKPSKRRVLFSKAY